MMNPKSWMQSILVWLLMASLAACGGGGGSPGATLNGGTTTSPSSVASVVLVASAATLANSGADGTEVTLTAIVKDANNNVLSGQTVDFKADSGSISNGTRKTGADGTVVEKLSTKGDTSLRTITVTANVGTVTSAPVKIQVVQAQPTTVQVAKVTLVASSSSMLNTGADGTEVTLTAIAKDANNNVVPGVTVGFSASSGTISSTNRTTDANGSVTEKLSTKGDSSLRTITVTASVGSLQSAQVQVSVVSVLPSAVRSVTLVPSSTSLLNTGASGTEVTLTAIAKDANNNVVPGATVSFAASSGTVSNTSRITDANGTVTEKLSVGGDTSLRTITVTASSGGFSSAPVSIQVVTQLPNKVASLLLIASNTSMLNTGAAGTEVTLTAIAKDASNNVLPGVTVNLSASSGTVSNTNRVTDANGSVTEKLSTAGDSSLRSITVSATSGTAVALPVTVQVVSSLPSSVAQVLLVPSASYLLNTGASGTEVGLTVVAKDANNNVVPGVTVGFTATSGSVSSTNRVTDANGTVSEKLSTVGDTSLRTITVTANVGGVKSAPVNVQVVSTVPSKVGSVILLASAPTLVNSGAAGTEVTLTAIVKDTNNSVLAGQAVDFKVSSGTLSTGSRVTDASGTVTEKLSTQGDTSLRTISVTVTAGGISSQPVQVQVISSSSAVPTVLIASSSDTLQSGKTVTLSVIVKDANNNLLPGAAVNLSASSGELTFTNRTTDASGTVTATLSTLDATPRTITLTASSGTSAQVTRSVQVVASAPSLLLTSSSNVLKSAGVAGTEVTIQALVKDASNGVVANTPVTFNATSGALSAITVSTNASGIASVTLGTGLDPTNRVITVTASVAGAPTTSTTVTVSGTSLAITAPTTVNLGQSTDITVTLTDSSGAPLANRSIAFQSAVNPLNSGNSGTAITNTLGQVTLRYTANVGQTDTVQVSALGASTSTQVQVNTTNFTAKITTVGASTALSTGTINTCYQITAHNDVAGTPQSGNVNIVSSRGNVFSDNTCTTGLTGTVALDGSGNAVAYLKATSPGVGVVSAILTSNGTTVQAPIEFTAPLLASSTISIQVDPAVIGTNAVGRSDQQATLRAVVKDSSATGNVVKNARVTFSIVTDPSGGYLTQPSSSLTGSDGSATVSYVAGATTTALDGVQIKAQIVDPLTSASATASLTVAKQSLFITAGTGKDVTALNSSTYQRDYVVMVTDSAGNPVSGVSLTGSVRPRNYYKGTLSFVGVGTGGSWVPTYSKTCANEDTDKDGILGPSEDVNGNGRLDPGIPVTISTTAKTDANGQATVSLFYPKDRTYWIDVDFVVRGSVAGTEARYVGYSVLGGNSSDYNSASVTPPGQTSPYGTSSVCTDTL